MATPDPLTTAAVGLVVGGISVVAHAVAHRLDGSLQKSRENTIVALFFALMGGFLFPWVWHFVADSLLEQLAFSGALVGFLWGGFVWLTFTLPSEIAHVVWERRSVRDATVGLGAWLATFLLGGLVAGAMLVP